ncbi:M56 family metallopeptidase [candidate division KSB1 bacterium]|nr:M56 family metallopeptidase [candidate division KSB1 bacterium]NIR69170.1 M56 family metallopeptidase [candidate division KSB1 bacterium]NIS25681.1 M56 family metallopeptidase [candidate division KSB1 bacterium]NIT72549.1 M56 family metallopeptidase [candidate division KSB1 bacterium]NIU26358.1 M56 family metallopeptidase [candidate division KSB1 bacterium]
MFSNWFAVLEGVSSAFLAFAQKEIVFSTILFAIVFVLTKLLRQRSAFLHYGLWTLVLLRLVLPTDLSSNFSARALFTKVAPIQSEQTDKAIETKKDEPKNLMAQSLTSESTSLREENRIESTAATPTSPSKDTSSFPVFSWEVILFLTWLAGASVFAVLFLRRYVYYRRMIRKSEAVTDAEIGDIVDSWSHRFEIKRKIKIVTSDGCLSPFTLGIFKPVIYMPKVMFEKSDSATVESVIAHELAHVKHWDDLWVKIQNLVQLVYFYHPVVWLLNSQLNEVRERICDELVLSDGTISPKAYGSSMLSVLKLNLMGTEGVEMLPSFGNHKKKFRDRIQDITRISKIKKSNLLLTYTTIAFWAVFLLPMAKSSSRLSDSDGIQTIKLKKHLNGEGEFGIHSVAAGSRFQKVTTAKQEENELFCDSTLPKHLSNLEYAAVGIFDVSYKKRWVIKGKNPNGKLEFYLDTDGDKDFTDEKPLKITKKTAKYHYEGSSKWEYAKYFKSQTFVDYEFSSDGKTRQGKFGIFLVYHPEKNFLEFFNENFWVGKARFGDATYPVALYGGIQSAWYLRPTFDDHPNVQSKNELRIDLNKNKYFEDMTVFDPESNQVVQEKYFVTEAFLVDGQYYEIKSIKTEDDHIELTIAPQPNSSQLSGTKDE